MMNGIINVYKEKGYTSFDVVAKLRGILKTKKIGHTGTLDPDAEGVLPVCLGKATKVCELLTDKTKEYEAVMLLGVTTDTQDATGTKLSSREVLCDEEEVRSAVESFVGDYMQIPPMYSALKVGGRKLCELRFWRSSCRGCGCVSPVRREPIFARSVRTLVISLAAALVWKACSARESETLGFRMH